MLADALEGNLVSDQTGFGRRKPPAASAAHVAMQARTLSDDAEAFRAQLAAERGGSEPGFSEWMRARQARRLMAWAIGFALLVPGLLSFFLNLPGYVSLGLEIAGVVINVWLRRERRKHLNDIARWEPEG
jgi:hypothetical protein